jgi:hypothetical protein
MAVGIILDRHSRNTNFQTLFSVLLHPMVACQLPMMANSHVTYNHPTATRALLKPQGEGEWFDFMQRNRCCTFSLVTSICHIAVSAGPIRISTYAGYRMNIYT